MLIQKHWWVIYIRVAGTYVRTCTYFVYCLTPNDTHYTLTPNIKPVNSISPITNFTSLKLEKLKYLQSSSCKCKETQGPDEHHQMASQWIEMLRLVSLILNLLCSSNLYKEWEAVTRSKNQFEIWEKRLHVVTFMLGQPPKFIHTTYINHSALVT